MATNWPTRVILKAVFLIVSATTSKARPSHFPGYFYNARAADADTDTRIAVGDAVEGAGHEGIVLYRIGEDDQFGTA